MTTLAVVVTLDPEGHFPDHLLGAVQDRDIVIEAQFVFEGGEETLHHGVVPAAAFGRHAAADREIFQQLPIGRCAVLAPLIGVDQALIGFDLAVSQSPVQGLQHQRRLHRGAHGPADHAAAVQVDPDRQIPPARCGTDVGDVTGPAAVGRCWAELSLQQVLCHTTCSVAWVPARPEPPSGLGLEV